KAIRQSLDRGIIHFRQQNGKLAPMGPRLRPPTCSIARRRNPAARFELEAATEIAVSPPNLERLGLRYPIATHDVFQNLRVGPGTMGTPHVEGETVLCHAG
ncbi:hypothetical protein, partial [Bradyrhizobium sp. HKCCYLRH3061]|uniref:hypothetical protein n=1 Tax=Bradyrhizobium sp. HKCCYLRH3061 TaxID=3420734 RepID=UPI003EC08B16